MNALIKLAFSDAGAGGVGRGGPPHHNGIGAVCWMYNRRDKRWRDVSSCTKGVNGMLQFAAWLLLGFCCTFNCKMGWLLAGLTVLGGRFG